MEKVYYDVFPYDDGSEDFVKMLLLQNQYAINDIYIPKTWKSTHNQVDEFDSLNFVKGVPPYAAKNDLIIVPSRSNINEQFLDNFIQSALERGRKVINLRNIKNTQAYADNPRFINYANRTTFFNEYKTSPVFNDDNPKIISAPIICIGSVIEGCGELLLQYKVKRILEAQGNKVLWIGSSSISEFFSAYGNLSNLYFDCNDFSKVIAKINHCINRALIETNSDILLVGAPKGVIALNDCIVNDYGVFFYLLSNAINIDYMITLLPNDEKINEVDIHELNSIMYYRFGIKNAYWWITDKKPYYYFIDTTQKFTLSKCRTDLCSNNPLDVSVYKHFEKQALERLLQSIENQTNTII